MSAAHYAPLAPSPRRCSGHMRVRVSQAVGSEVGYSLARKTRRIPGIRNKACPDTDA
eukprot:CAMPEP_0173346278 /NCGR_PEP_ID=MMETSP1144-20121109/12473_1 /TAXON_ID=483371 /ORGANISM="non described non described, Strain CCMP2298" /LENGTH=56 /DNA_ID=CAMNT_0014293563 /DNA_START=133 /DNA_END=303 /DNA_ORIENTATION=+